MSSLKDIRYADVRKMIEKNKLLVSHKKYVSFSYSCLMLWPVRVIG